MLDEILMAESYFGPPKFNKIGEKFGDGCIVIAYLGKKGKSYNWLAECGDCKNMFNIISKSLPSVQRCRSCARKQIAKDKFCDLTGYKWNYLTVVKLMYQKNRASHWLVRCDCGESMIIPTARITSKSASITSCKKCAYKLSSQNNIHVHDLKGLIFGLGCEVLERNLNKKTKYNVAHWNCRCGICGNIFVSSSGTIKKTKGCAKCAHLLAARKKEQHHKWNPNLTDEDRQKRRIDKPGYVEWRKNILQRDRYKCQICGFNKRLRTHHLDGWDNFPDKRFNVDNGITLCYNCHERFHKICGRGDNTITEYLEFKLCQLPSEIK